MESGAGLAVLPEGSETGYKRLLGGQVIAAAIHFHDPADLQKDANVATVAAEPRLYDAVLVGFASREQGLLVARHNPLALTDVTDAATREARFALRPEGAGAQLLLAALVARAGLAMTRLVAPLVAPTGPDIAQAIRAGHADCGIATRAVAEAAGLDFVPIAVERFDLLMRQRDSYRPRLQRLLAFLRTDAFARRASELGGLDVTSAGTVRWAP